MSLEVIGVLLAVPWTVASRTVSSIIPVDHHLVERKADYFELAAVVRMFKGIIPFLSTTEGLRDNQSQRRMNFQAAVQLATDADIGARLLERELYTWSRLIGEGIDE